MIELAEFTGWALFLGGAFLYAGIITYELVTGEEFSFIGSCL